MPESSRRRLRCFLLRGVENFSHPTGPTNFSRNEFHFLNGPPRRLPVTRFIRNPFIHMLDRHEGCCESIANRIPTWPSARSAAIQFFGMNQMNRCRPHLDRREDPQPSFRFLFGQEVPLIFRFDQVSRDRHAMLWGSSCFQFSLWRASMRASKEMDTAETFSLPRIEEGSARGSSLWGSFAPQRVHWWSWCARKDIVTRCLGHVLFSLLFSPSECRRYDFSSILRIIVKILRVIQNGRGYFDLINFFITWVFFSSHIFILNVIWKWF